MVSESLAIVCVILVMSVMYRRAGKRELAIMALPLGCVPLARLICVALFGRAPIYGHVFIAVGFVASVALCALVSRDVANRKVRGGYMALSVLFSGALVAAYLLRGAV